jgi:hypothetical protein
VDARNDKADEALNHRRGRASMTKLKNEIDEDDAMESIERQAVHV